MKRLAQAAPIQRQQFLQNSISIFAGMQAVLAIAGNPARFERDLIGTERTEEQVGEPALHIVGGLRVSVAVTDQATGTQVGTRRRESP